MDKITELLKTYYAGTYDQYGPTAKGVDWNDESELAVRYDKMLSVLNKDFAVLPERPSLLDVGCGWGGLYQHAISRGVPLGYSGIDVVKSMIDHGAREFSEAQFIHGDVFDLEDVESHDFVVCNAILTQKLDVTILDMERFTKNLIKKMFALCHHGIAFNLMSTRVNFMVNNLYYQNPSELLSWLLTEISPRVRLDHGYSSLISGRGKFYDFTVYVYKG